MAFFSELETAVMKAVQLLLQDQTLCKLLYYTDSKDPLAQPDITDTSILLNKNIFPLPKDSKSVDQTHAFINVYYPKITQWKTGRGFNKPFLRFDVVCHVDSWLIDNGIRTYAIMSEVDKIFNDKNIQELSNQKIWFDSATCMMYSDYFYGFSMIYMLTQDGNVGC